MDEAGVNKFLTLIGTKPADKNEDWIRASCPLAFSRHKNGTDKNPSFAVKVVTGGKSICNCFACGVRGDLSGLLFELTYALKKGEVNASVDLAQAYALLEEEANVGYIAPDGWTETVIPAAPIFEPWPDWWLDTYPAVFGFHSAMAYLRGRHVPDVVSDFLDLRFDMVRKMVGVPFRDKQGLLAGMRGRNIMPNAKLAHYDYDYSGASNSGMVWLGEHWVDWSQPVVLVEGAYDLVNVFRSYRNVMANFTATLKYHKARKLAFFPKVVVFSDRDKAGDVMLDSVRSYVGKDTVVTRVKYPTMDPKCKDPGSLSVEEIRDALLPHVDLHPFIKDDAESIHFPFDNQN